MCAINLNGKGAWSESLTVRTPGVGEQAVITRGENSTVNLDDGDHAVLPGNVEPGSSNATTSNDPGPGSIHSSVAVHKEPNVSAVSSLTGHLETVLIQTVEEVS